MSKILLLENVPFFGVPEIGQKLHAKSCCQILGKTEIAFFYGAICGIVIVIFIVHK